MKEEPLSYKKISNLDNQAEELGMGGKLSPEKNEISYKTVSYTHLTLPTTR